jgi:hypothetical protein
MPINSSDQNFGRIGRLYPDDGGVYFRLVGGKTDMNPTSGYYRLEVTHANYNAMLCLLYLAANMAQSINVETAPNLSADGFAIVSYFYVDF